MAYLDKPGLFHIEQSGWFTALKEHGGEHLTLAVGKKEKEGTCGGLKKLVRKLRERKKAVKYALRIYKYLISNEKWY